MLPPSHIALISRREMHNRIITAQRLCAFGLTQKYYGSGLNRLAPIGVDIKLYDSPVKRVLSAKKPAERRAESCLTARSVKTGARAHQPLPVR